MRTSFLHLLGNLAEYRNFERQHAAELLAQRTYEAVLGSLGTFTVPGYCVACEAVRPLQVDLQSSNGVTPNWRERLLCSCGLNNRARAALDFLDDLTRGHPLPRLYATEQMGPFFSHLQRRFPAAVGSEFLHDGTPPGSANASGLRHEDLTHLSFRDASFDLVLSFDVLEHVPDYRRAFREIARILAPGGRLLATFPFDYDLPDTVERAALSPDGSIIHHFPPEFHGDPRNNAGCLCFQVFGWSVLDELREAGFAEATTVFYWSADAGYLGKGQLMVVARR